jgi:alkaline phosphatase D
MADKTGGNPTFPVTRRSFMQGAAAAALLPAPAFAQARPRLLDGLQSGDLAGDAAMVWARCDRAASLIIEWDTTDSFRNATRVVGGLAAPGSGGTAMARLTGLPAGQQIFWRATFEDADRPGATSEPATGRLRTHGAGKPVRFVFGGDQVGEGWGINPDRGGMRIYDTMLKAEPDFLIHLGDRIYSDAVLKETRPLPDGSVWRNIVTPAKSHIAETLADYRGNYSYNFLDGPYRAFAAAVPQLCTWDDHEVSNNWWPGRRRQKKKYSVDFDTLAQRGRQAFFDYTPMPRHPADPDRLYRSIRHGDLVEVFMLDTHSYRAPNRKPENAHPASRMLGEAQTAWLKDALARSSALWKVIATSVPIEVRTAKTRRQDKWADGVKGNPRGREVELAGILAFIKERRIRNAVWVAADVHYGAAVHFHPDRAAVDNFDPFWEFIAGPFLTNTRKPHRMDPTFGPNRVFATTSNGVEKPITPLQELFWYGQGDIDPASGALTMTTHDLHGKALFTQVLEAKK